MEALHCWTNHLLINWCSSCKIFCKSQDKGKMSMGFCAQQGEMISDTFDQWLGWYGMEGKVVDMIWKICNIWKIWLIWYGRETRWVEMIWIWKRYGRYDMIWYGREHLLWFSKESLELLCHPGNWEQADFYKNTKIITKIENSKWYPGNCESDFPLWLRITWDHVGVRYYCVARRAASLQKSSNLAPDVQSGPTEIWSLPGVMSNWG